MNSSMGQHSSTAVAVQSSELDKRRWWGVLAVTIVALLGVLAIYWETALSMVAIWWRSDTYAHGFLILPISVYLIWQQRDALAKIRPRPDLWALPVLVGLIGVWVVARLVDVQVVQQLCLVAMLITVVWAVLGRKLGWAIAFPLGFLFFSVPIGEFLVYPMMDFTADFLVRMLQLTGIPVYWEGTFITIPSGDWSVVEGCSGVRYIIASVAVGTLYAYLFYHSIWRRLAFILFSLIMPVFANGMRAYIIVMIGHLSDMKLATGADHLIYGWVFFGMVIMLMFWIGSFWWDQPAKESESGSVATEAEIGGLSLANFSMVTVAVLAVAALGPLALTGMQFEERPASAAIHVPRGDGGWQAIDTPLVDWEPLYGGETVRLFQTYRKGDHKVALYLYYFLNQRQGEELVNSQNVLVPQKHSPWERRGTTTAEVSVGDRGFTVKSSQIKSPNTSLVVWEWYWLDGFNTINSYLAKLMEAKGRILRSGVGSAGIVLATPATGTQQGNAVLEDFTRAMLPAIESSLRGY